MRPAWFSTTAEGSLKPSLTPPAGDTSSLATALKLHTLTASSDALPPVPYDLMWQDDRYWFPLLIGD
jgi:hypothetical protein